MELVNFFYNRGISRFIHSLFHYYALCSLFYFGQFDHAIDEKSSPKGTTHSLQPTILFHWTYYDNCFDEFSSES